jgi:hypothetical protein
MDATTPSSTPSTTPTATPSVEATPTPQPTPQAVPQMAQGGSTSSGGGFKETLKNMNWVEVGFGILGATALFYAIYYFRYNINNQKSFVKNMEGKVDDLTIKMHDISSAMSKPKEDSLEVFI